MTREQEIRALKARIGRMASASAKCRCYGFQQKGRRCGLCGTRHLDQVALRARLAALEAEKKGDSDAT